MNLSPLEMLSKLALMWLHLEVARLQCFRLGWYNYLASLVLLHTAHNLHVALETNASTAKMRG